MRNWLSQIVLVQEGKKYLHYNISRTESEGPTVDIERLKAFLEGMSEKEITLNYSYFRCIEQKEATERFGSTDFEFTDSIYGNHWRQDLDLNDDSKSLCDSIIENLKGDSIQERKKKEKGEIEEEYYIEERPKRTPEEQEKYERNMRLYCGT